jgi:hypothetical protein
VKCETVKVGEVTAIVCGSRPKGKRCACGLKSSKLCDWKVGGTDARGRPATCSKPLCSGCAYSPSWDKDLCPEHAKLWAEHPSNPKNKAKASEEKSEIRSAEQ